MIRALVRVLQGIALALFFALFVVVWLALIIANSGPPLQRYSCNEVIECD